MRFQRKKKRARVRTPLHIAFFVMTYACYTPDDHKYKSAHTLTDKFLAFGNGTALYISSQKEKSLRFLQDPLSLAYVLII